MYNFRPINENQISNLLNSWGIKSHKIIEEVGGMIIVIPKFRYFHIDVLIKEIQERVPASCIVKLRRDTNWFWL